MVIQMYTFPMERDGLVAVEKALMELEVREREGEKLSQEEYDWMDYATAILFYH